MTSLDWARVLLVFIPAIDLMAVLILWHAVRTAGGWKRAPHTLVERTVAAGLIWLAASFIATLALLGLLHLTIPGDVQLAIIMVAVVLPSITSLIWVVRWWTGGYGDET